MDWCEDNGVQHIFGLAGNAAQHGLGCETADDLKVYRIHDATERMPGFAEFDYVASSWSRQREVVARVEATMRDIGARYIDTSFEDEPGRLRGRAEGHDAVALFSLYLGMSALLAMAISQVAAVPNKPLHNGKASLTLASGWYAASPEKPTMENTTARLRRD